MNEKFTSEEISLIAIVQFERRKKLPGIVFWLTTFTGTIWAINANIMMNHCAALTYGECFDLSLKWHQTQNIQRQCSFWSHVHCTNIICSLQISYDAKVFCLIRSNQQHLLTSSRQQISPHHLKDIWILQIKSTWSKVLSCTVSTCETPPQPERYPGSAFSLPLTAGRAKKEMANTEKQDAIVFPIHVCGTLSPYPMVVTVTFGKNVKKLIQETQFCLFQTKCWHLGSTTWHLRALISCNKSNLSHDCSVWGQRHHLYFSAQECKGSPNLIKPVINIVSNPTREDFMSLPCVFERVRCLYVCVCVCVI